MATSLETGHNGALPAMQEKTKQGALFAFSCLKIPHENVKSELQGLDFKRLEHVGLSCIDK